MGPVGVAQPINAAHQNKHAIKPEAQLLPSFIRWLFIWRHHQFISVVLTNQAGSPGRSIQGSSCDSSGGGQCGVNWPLWVIQLAVVGWEGEYYLTETVRNGGVGHWGHTLMNRWGNVFFFFILPALPLACQGLPGLCNLSVSTSFSEADSIKIMPVAERERERVTGVSLILPIGFVLFFFVLFFQIG